MCILLDGGIHNVTFCRITLSCQEGAKRFAELLFRARRLPVSFEQWEEALTSLCNSVLGNAVVSMRNNCQLRMRHARLAVTLGPWTEGAPSSLLHTMPNVRCLLRHILLMKIRQRSYNNIFHLWFLNFSEIVGALKMWERRRGVLIM